MSKRVGDYILTQSGVEFYPFDPRVEEIKIEDIAHSLSLQCRFTGHTKFHYSVAQHSVLVSEICAPEDALWGLLHDASEAYLTDVSRPLKYSSEFTSYRLTEKRLMFRIAERFGLPSIEPWSVSMADKIMLGIEARDLMPAHPCWDRWIDAIPENVGVHIVKYDPEMAEYEFLARFAELT